MVGFFDGVLGVEWAFSLMELGGLSVEWIGLDFFFFGGVGFASGFFT